MLKAIKLIIFLLAVVWQNSVYSEEGRLREPSEILQAIDEAQTQFDYEFISEYKHPRSLRTFRKTVSRFIEIQVNKWGEDLVQIALDCPEGLYQLDDYDDRAYFTHIMECSTILMPEDVKPGLKILTESIEGNHHYVVYRKVGKLETIDTKNRFVTSRSMEFQKHNEQWYSVGTQLRRVEHYLSNTCKRLSISKKIPIIRVL